jgi:hypothetical protein
VGDTPASAQRLRYGPCGVAQFPQLASLLELQVLDHAPKVRADNVELGVDRLQLVDDHGDRRGECHRAYRRNRRPSPCRAYGLPRCRSGSYKPSRPGNAAVAHVLDQHRRIAFARGREPQAPLRQTLSELRVSDG